MLTPKLIRHFLKEYKLLTFVIFASIIGGIFKLVSMPIPGDWALSIGALTVIIPLLRDMIEDIRSGAYGIDVLAITAIITSVLLQQYWAAIVIALMLTGGKSLEDYAEQRAKTELNTLMAHKPKLAHLIQNEKIIDVAVKTIVIDNMIEVLPGEVIPVDAVITEGTTTVDESSLTGESTPIEKTVDDEILSGSINMDSSIIIRALRQASESQYQQIINLVRAAASTQALTVI